MSFSAHKRDALDATMPLNHRMSHLRSCARLMGQKYHVPRSDVIARVQKVGGVDITVRGNDADIRRAMTVLLRIKESGLSAAETPPVE